MNVRHFKPQEYLKLSEASLPRLREARTVCACARLPRSDVILLTLIAPVGSCWGMEFALSNFYESAVARVVHKVTERSLQEDLENTDLDPSRIASGLIPIPDDADGIAFEYGGEANGLPTWWARSYVLPDDGIGNTLDAALELWSRHEEELGRYFLLQYSDAELRAKGAGSCFRPWATADVLDRLFCTRTGPLGVGPEVLLEELTKYTKSGNLETLSNALTPAFLLQECIRWDASLVGSDSPFRDAVMREVRNELTEYDIDAITDLRTRIALLRVRIARSLHWPLGVRLLRRTLKSIPEDLCAASVLCAETRRYIDEASVRYPALLV